jgi:hypothetical protein
MKSKLALSVSFFIFLAMMMLLLNNHSIAASPEIHNTAKSTWISSNTPFVANSWMIAGLCLVVLLMGYWGFRIYKMETPGIVFTKGVSFTPIGVGSYS